MLGARDAYVADIPAAARRRYRECCNGRRLQLESVRRLFAMGGGAGGDFLQALAGFCLAHSVTVTIQMALGGIRPLYMTRFAILLGLPARGETAQAFPPEWAGSVVKASSSSSLAPTARVGLQPSTWRRRRFYRRGASEWSANHSTGA